MEAPTPLFDLHLNVCSDDTHGKTLHVSLRRRREDHAGFYIESGTMPRAYDLIFRQQALRQRSEHLVNADRVHPRDRDILSQDLSALREYRSSRGQYGGYGDYYPRSYGRRWR